MRKATPDDLPHILALYRACAALPTSCWDEEYPSEAIAREDIEQGWLYLYGDKGAVSLLTWDDLEDEVAFSLTEKPCVLCRVCLAPAHQGKGEGKHLLAAAEEQARQLGYRCMHLLVDVDNPIAHRMYESAGYAHVTQADMYGCTFAAMEKAL